MNDRHDVPPPGPLTFLSLQHPPRGVEPIAPSNEERVRAYRNTLPILPGNNYGWSFRTAGLRTATG